MARRAPGTALAARAGGEAVAAAEAGAVAAAAAAAGTAEAIAKTTNHNGRTTGDAGEGEGRTRSTVIPP